MKASEIKLQRVLEGTNQYVVPLFQRAYSWDRKEWTMLWEDILELCETDSEKRRPHFIGSMVTMQTVSVPEGVAKYLLIDGQQRYTTILLLLSALRDVALRNNDERFANEIKKRFLVNEFEQGADFYKLQPTQTDREIFYNIINTEGFDENTKIAKAYRFFERKLSSNMIDFQNLKQVITSYLSVVSIVLDSDDDPHLVFESLNAKGRSLTQSDLMRNYFFMRINANDHETLYQKYWFPMESALGDKLKDCVRHYLMKDMGFVKESEVYFTLKDNITTQKAEDKLKELAKFAEYYHKLINPEMEKSAKLSRAIHRLNRIQVSTSYPFFLNCYQDYENGNISEESFAKIFNIVENFVIRRFICNIPTNQLNKIFPDLYKQAQKQNPSDLVEGVKSVLQNKGYPKDIDFRKNLSDMKLYGVGDRLAKAKFILDSLEESFNHREQVPLENCTIEHIMPQTLTSWWEKHLGEHYEYIHEMFLHTIGNLTLTKYNSELSNSSFENKKEIFKESNIILNRYFTDFDVTNWTIQEIKQRTEWLVDKSLIIWEYFGSSSTNTLDAMTNKYTFETMNNGDFLEGDNLELLEKIQLAILDLDLGIAEEIQKQTIEYKIGKSIFSIVPLRSGLKIYINLQFSELYDPEKLARDVSNVGHWGVGDVELKITSPEKIPYLMFIIKQAYNKVKGIK
ncbi:MAG: DUF262 domain-containing protein [Cytophagales bacterium]|nr:MAG: DUF262 domain-containing protein [Cytophagales bacterium]